MAVGVRESIFELREERARRRRGVGGFMPWPPCPYEVDEAWEEELHHLVDAPWPCPMIHRFWSLWEEVVASMQSRAVALGRGAFGGWGDGEPGLVRAVWCLTHHLRPATVLETGVARGITTRFVLEALRDNGQGRLWSVDRPPLGDRALAAQTAIAVPAELRDRWSYVRGSSRRVLRGLVEQLEGVDLFVHDSRHTARNLGFELERVWPALRPDGAVVADDVDLNCAFQAFTSAHAGHRGLLCHAEPLAPDPGRQDDRGVFGVIVKSRAGRA
jgi:hypothetical protein